MKEQNVKMIQLKFKVSLIKLKSKYFQFHNQQNLRVFIPILQLLNLLGKNKNQLLISSLLELLPFKTQYFKDVIGLSEELIIQEKITIIISTIQNQIGLQKLKYLKFNKEIDQVAIKLHYLVLEFRYHEVKERSQEQYLIFLMSQVKQEDFLKVLRLLLLFWSALQQNTVSY